MKAPLGSPCRECPFRKTSLQGYLGASTVEEFVLQAESGEVPMPCHLEVNYQRKDWKAKQEKVHQCSGHAIFLSNMCKGFLGKGVKRLPANLELVFHIPSHMIDYHSFGKIKTTMDARIKLMNKLYGEGDS